jgi:hypothetical protein
MGQHIIRGKLKGLLDFRNSLNPKETFARGSTEIRFPLPINQDFYDFFFSPEY